MSPDISYFETPFVYWPMAESSLGIIGACLPQMCPFANTVYRGFMRHYQSMCPPIGKTLASDIV